MTGKIFAESANIYQDQAKILFEYYREAAEKIVSEEEALEKEIAVATEYKAQLSDELPKISLMKIVGFSTAGVLIALAVLFIVLNSITPRESYFSLIIVSILAAIGAGIFGLMKLLKKNNLDKELLATDAKIESFQNLHKEIFRDYKVTKLGVGYVPVAGQIAFEDKSFLIDYTGSKNNESFVLQTLRQSDLFTSKITELEAMLKEVPMVENSNETEVVDTDQYSTSIQQVTYHDYFGNLDRNLRTSAFCMEDLDVTSVSLPVILPDSDYARYLNEHSTNDPGNKHLFEPFDTSKYLDDIDRFHSLNEMKKSLERRSIQFEDVLKNLMVNMANSVQAITKLKVSSTNQLIDQSNRLLFKILKTSYNHYSPSLEAEEIERIRTESFDFSQSVEKYEPFQLKQSSRVKFDLTSDCWVAEDGRTTNHPFGMHQIHEEIVAPIVQNLMQETRLERFKIYNSIKDQKISYLNKWHQDTEDFYGRNRAESNDLINIMRSTLSEYIAAFNTLSALEDTEQSMSTNGSLNSTVVKSTDNSADVFAAFNIKSKEFQAIQTEFAEYMERLKGDIELKAEKFEHIEYYDASLRDSSPKNMAVATKRMQDLAPRRKQLIAVNPFYAETSELPPEPNIENITYEHMSLNLSAIAKSALNDLNDITETTSTGNDADEFEFDTPDNSNEDGANISDETVAAGANESGVQDQDKPIIEPTAKTIAEDEATIDDIQEEALAAGPITPTAVEPEIEPEKVVDAPGEIPAAAEDIVPANAETTVEPGEIDEETLTSELETVPAVDTVEPGIEVDNIADTPIIDEIISPEADRPAEAEKTIDKQPGQNSDAAAMLTSNEIEAIAKKYTTIFADEFQDQIVFVSPVGINTHVGYDGLQIACEDKNELEQSPNFRELVIMDKSTHNRFIWMELKDDGNILYTLEVLLVLNNDKNN